MGILNKEDIFVIKHLNLQVLLNIWCNIFNIDNLFFNFQ